MVKNTKNKIIVFLLSAVACLWGIILYNMIVYFTLQDEEEVYKNEDIEKDNTTYISAKKNIGNEEEIFYEEIERDPFIFKKTPVKPVEEIVPPTHIPPGSPKTKLNYQVNGTIVNDKSRLVIFEDVTNNKTLFLREGEIYNGIKITSITVDKIKIYEDEEEKEILIRK